MSFAPESNHCRTPAGPPDSIGGPGRWRSWPVLRSGPVPRWPVLLAAAGLAAFGYVTAVDPNQPGHYPLCPFRAVTGYYCPGCGSLRALHALGHGQLTVALHKNPLTVLGLPLLAWAWVAWVQRSRTGRPMRRVAPQWLIWTGLSVLIVFWVLRNLPGFGWLAP